jgi:N utilization substance protein B
MMRKTAREIVMRLCFAVSAGGENADELVDQFFDQEYYASLAEEDDAYAQFPDEASRAYISATVKGIGVHSAELDSYIDKYAVGWKFSRISRTALAIMKTAMYEIMYMPDIPVGVSVNEAVELAKKYDGSETAAFINGILGTFARKELSES